MVVHDLDYEAMSLVIKLLDRKVLLINQLRELNDYAESLVEARDDAPQGN